VGIDVIQLLHDVTDAVHAAVATVSDFGFSGGTEGQYTLDLHADAAALAVLHRAGVGVLSEESGLQRTASDVVVIIDPVDGSTNCARGVPWYACALCAVDGDGPLAAVVTNLASGVRYMAERGGGAWRDGRRLEASGCVSLGEAIVALNGSPRSPLGVQQTRQFGASALDLCLVAEGVLDGYVDCVALAHGVWDYAGSALICHEAGALVVDAWGRDLYEFHERRRMTPVAAATKPLLDELLAVRRQMGPPERGD
jgi:fructose-1,6-bisphosphatase/inositol monophosphatase family enzyme